MSYNRVIHYVCARCKKTITVQATFPADSDPEMIARVIRNIKRSPLLCEPCADELGVDFMPHPDGYKRKARSPLRRSLSYVGDESTGSFDNGPSIPEICDPHVEG